MATQKNITSFFKVNDKSPKSRSCESANNEPGPSSTKRKADDQDESTARKKRVKLFQQKWLSEFDWLRCADDGTGLMICTTCESVSNTRKSLKCNAFVKGSANFQRSALTRHMESDDHALSKKTIVQKRNMEAHKNVQTNPSCPFWKRN